MKYLRMLEYALAYWEPTSEPCFAPKNPVQPRCSATILIVCVFRVIPTFIFCNSSTYQ